MSAKPVMADFVEEVIDVLSYRPPKIQALVVVKSKRLPPNRAIHDLNTGGIIDVICGTLFI